MILKKIERNSRNNFHLKLIQSNRCSQLQELLKSLNHIINFKNLESDQKMINLQECQKIKVNFSKNEFGKTKS
jgi:hypothetical protein